MCVCACVLLPRPCYTACSIVWLFAVFMPVCEHIALSLGHCVTMFELQLMHLADALIYGNLQSPLNRPAQHCVHFKKGQNTMSRAGRRDEETHKAQWISVMHLTVL